MSDDKLFIGINDGSGGGSYGILDITNQTISELGIEYIQSYGDVSVLSDYSKLALRTGEGTLKIYNNLPTLDNTHTIDLDRVQNPHLIKNKWLD